MCVCFVHCNDVILVGIFYTSSDITAFVCVYLFLYVCPFHTTVTTSQVIIAMNW